MPREALRLAPQDRVKVYVSLFALAGVLVLAVAFVAVTIAFASPRLETRTYVARVSDLEVGQPLISSDRTFAVVKLEDGTVVAFHLESTHLGCQVVWRPSFFANDRGGAPIVGVFFDICSHSRWTSFGVRTFGPAPRDLDRYTVIVERNSVYVEAIQQKLIRGTPRFW